MKTIIVTGASRGLGLDISRELHISGYRVIAVSRTMSPGLEKFANSSDFFIELFDLSKVDEIRVWVQNIVSKYGRIYGLINNAAIGTDGVLGTMHEMDIAKLIQTNIQSPIVLTKYVSRSMLISGRGRIVNISSIIASTGFSGLSVYAATKAALIGFTKSLSRELGKAGITVNAVSPGYMETSMTESISAENLATIKRRSPSGKLAATHDVAVMVRHLMSDEAKSINGSNITIDAGSTA